jgi:hypothetical protein
LRSQHGVVARRQLLALGVTADGIRHRVATFTLTDSELEPYFLPIARGAGLPEPLTQQEVNGYRATASATNDTRPRA